MADRPHFSSTALVSLKEYQAKRNFNRTQEPSGNVHGRKARQLRFVVQKHDATRLHYDFRLEMERVLKSWAVPKGFPTVRGDRRLAVEVEDHPIEYGDFEGTIPEGNYGAGTVMLWDTGTYEVFGDDPLGALRDGKLHFVLKGKKLKGEWALVRMRRSEGDKPQWLLLKSGEDVAPISEKADNTSVLTRRSMEGIAGAKRKSEWQSNRGRRGAPPPATKSRSARQLKRSPPTPESEPPSPPGIDLKSLPSRKAGFVEPMKARLMSELPKGRDWVYEIKFDGVRALAIKKGKTISLISRAGNALTGRFPDLVKNLSRLPAKEAVLDGEVVALDPQGRPTFQLLQTYQSSAEKPPLFYYVFDALNYEGKDLTGLELPKRKQLAEQIVSAAGDNIRFSRSIESAPARLVSELKGRGLEGLIAKRRDSTYEPGRRSGAWVKFKWCNEQEFVIGGYTPPQGARSRFGAVLVGYYASGKLMFAGKVGTGFDGALLDSLYTSFQKIIRSDCPFANLPEKLTGPHKGMTLREMRSCTWVEPKLVCQVRFSEWTRDNHLRQPAFLGLRDDKDPPEVVKEEPSV